MNITPWEIFREFLQELAPDDSTELFARFEAFHRLLVDINREVNLISRKMPEEQYWTVHYLDSLLPLRRIDCKDRRVLDFGTGGGLPGIPLSLLNPTSEFTLLDSKLKKIQAIKKIVNLLDLHGCTPFASRIEEYASVPKPPTFDLIVCRSVRYEPIYREPLKRLLRPEGMVWFYKAHDESDVAVLPDPQRWDVSHPAVGTRVIVGFKRKSLEK